MEEVQRRTLLAPLASPCFIPSLQGLETEELLAFQERVGITSIVQWNLRPVIFGVENPQWRGGVYKPIRGRDGNRPVFEMMRWSDC